MSEGYLSLASATNVIGRWNLNPEPCCITYVGGLNRIISCFFGTLRGLKPSDILCFWQVDRLDVASREKQQFHVLSLQILPLSL